MKVMRMKILMTKMTMMLMEMMMIRKILNPNLNQNQKAKIKNQKEIRVAMVKNLNVINNDYKYMYRSIKYPYITSI